MIILGSSTWWELLAQSPAFGSAFGGGTELFLLCCWPAASSSLLTDWMSWQEYQWATLHKLDGNTLRQQFQSDQAWSEGKAANWQVFPSTCLGTMAPPLEAFAISDWRIPWNRANSLCSCRTDGAPTALPFWSSIDWNDTCWDWKPEAPHTPQVSPSLTQDVLAHEL